jgi:tRNA-Thr(GGU) m(6)t(6)A37 methyltransferase TsaA
MAANEYSIRPIGHVRSVLKSLADAPRQGDEGAPRARLELSAEVAEGLMGLRPGDDVIVLTWFHLARRDVLRVRPRNDPSLPIAGVFCTRSPDRPNPIGLHRVRVVAISGGMPGAPAMTAPTGAGMMTTPQGAWMEVEPLEAVDGTPIVDIKPVLDAADR